MLPCNVWCIAINGRFGDTMIADGLYRYKFIVVKNSIRQKVLEVQLQEALLNRKSVGGWLAVDGNLPQLNRSRHEHTNLT